MRIFILVVIMFVAIGSQTSLACEFEVTSFEERVNTAEKIFVGTVSQVGNGQATFKVERGIKNALPSDVVTVPIISNTCGLAFEAGEQWLYMGNNLNAGSKRLKFSTGQIQPEAVEFLNQKFPEKPANSN